MSREEELGSQLFGQNLFETLPDDEDRHWIIRSAPSPETGIAREYEFTGKEYQAAMAAQSLGGTYERIIKTKRL